MFSSRLAAQLKKHVLRRSLPHGIVSWQYILLRPSEKVCLHRALWLKAKPPQIPKALFLTLEFLLWLRWVSFTCWRLCLSAVARRGKSVADQDGIGRAAQLGRLLHLGLGHCIPPGEVYAFGLHRRESRQDFWDYVFIREVQAFHRWRGARTGERPESLALLQDKFRLAEFLRARGVPMAPILAWIARGSDFAPAPCLHTCSRIFCKPNHGSAGRDGFIVESRGKNIAVFAAKNGVKAQHSSLDCLRKAMAEDDFLIQPFLENHPDFAGLCPGEDVITLRVITEIHPERGMECYCAMVEIPNLADGAFKGHIILPIEPSAGRIRPCPRRLPPEVKARHNAVHDKINHGAVPFWETIMQSAFLAHRCFTDIHAIAWDYVVTPTGPVMLEGNTGWATTTPQMLHGGLLRHETVTG